MDNLFSGIIGNEMTFLTYVYCTLAALVCGIIASVCAAYKAHNSKSFTIALVLLPIIVETVIIMVNGSVGTGVAVMGAFSLVRFRSVPGKAKDIAAIFLAMTAGLACATGYIAIAVIFSIIVGGIMLIFAHLPLKDERTFDLTITIPETLNYNNAFDDIFEKYTRSASLVKMKTSHMGSLFKLFYRFEVKEEKEIKNMIDEIRCRNGNLEISVYRHMENREDL